LAFGSHKTMKLSDFIDFNTSVSSEMFISVMNVIHERLPCSQYVFKQKKAFK
jgi:hypothetical protein